MTPEEIERGQDHHHHRPHERETAPKPEQATRSGGSRSGRHNNPGNLEYSPFARAHGAIGTDGRFAIFPDVATGTAAQRALLFKSDPYKNLTLPQAISRWAPGSENNVPAYARAVGGDTSGKRMKDYSPAEQDALLRAMRVHEGWKPGEENLGPEAPGIEHASRKRLLLGLGEIPLSGAAAEHGASYSLGHMDPEFRSRLGHMMKAAKAAGRPLSVFSGYRSQEHQDRLFAASDRSGHMVARHSHHTAGSAADLRGDLAWAHKHASEFGLRFPMPWESWHIEPIRGRAASAVNQKHSMRENATRVASSETGADRPSNPASMGTWYNPIPRGTPNSLVPEPDRSLPPRGGGRGTA